MCWLQLLSLIRFLDHVGICVVPGSGFGQEPGTFHLRTTFLPQEEKIDELLVRMERFHAEFMAKWQAAA